MKGLSEFFSLLVIAFIGGVIIIIGQIIFTDKGKSRYLGLETEKYFVHKDGSYPYKFYKKEPGYKLYIQNGQVHRKKIVQNTSDNNQTNNSNEPLIQREQLQEQIDDNQVPRKKSRWWANNPEDVEKIVEANNIKYEYDLDEIDIQTVKDILNDPNINPELKGSTFCNYSIKQCNWCSNQIKSRTYYITTFQKIHYFFSNERDFITKPDYYMSTDDISQICSDYRNGIRYYCALTERPSDYCSRKCENEARNRY
jgi:hypothetical protein